MTANRYELITKMINTAPHYREHLKSSRRWVIKIGSALLTNDGAGLNKENIKIWVAQIAMLRKAGLEVVLVSSGAVAEGMSRLGVSERPTAVHELQAAAAVGQMGLVQAYESEFSQYGLHTAQVLLTHDDLSNRQRYLNARSTIRSLLELKVIPVINENDTVVTDEIRFGDNDTLAALVANLIEADHLIILTDQDGLFDKNPRSCSGAKIIQQANVNDAALDTMVESTGGKFGSGGMLTKLRAARLAARSGTNTIIASGRDANNLTRIYAADNIGSLLFTENKADSAHKQWLAGHLQMRGTLTVDEGAAKVLNKSGSSLLSVGIKSVNGQFNRGEMVSCVSLDGKQIACGLVNYNADEIRRLMGKASSQIKDILGYINEDEIIHRDNLVLV